ncbi:glutathione S-transferase family protein [Massilia luteola]|uniref:glutathione S-transferase family protein n=1 Tax=Massilia luteola TaxID=3081751 RepID=UPI002ACC0573|nr:glutathione S-transferase family protein [Massilia sp. Gc5]
MPTLTTFRSVPSFAVGHVRDLRVRWALEEIGQPYDMRLIGFEEKDSPAYRREQPFGQVPVLQDGDLTLFESGAILLHLGERHPALLPRDPAERANVTMWMFAALNSVEPYLGNLANLVAFSMDQPWAAAQRPVLEEIALKRLGQVDAWLEGRAYLAGDFSAADILMTTVVRLLDGMGYVERFARLTAWRDRCTARPAYRKALADQVAQFAAAPMAA